MTSATPKPRAGEHTPGPWRIRKLDDREGWIISGGNSDLPVDRYGIWNEANAQRIVACVNACEGIATENLEHFSLDFGKELRADVDELLQALKSLIFIGDSPQGVIIGPRGWEIVQEALAKHGR